MIRCAIYMELQPPSSRFKAWKQALVLRITRKRLTKVDGSNIPLPILASADGLKHDKYAEGRIGGCAEVRTTLFT